MYNEYFGLNESPFSIAPDPRYLYMSNQHREALAHLVYGFNSDGGFVLLTGEVGTGKTTVCRCLLEQVPENTAIAFILNPKLSVEELLATICDEFGIQYPDDRNSVKRYVDLINAYLLDAHNSGRRAVLIIDEAQNLSSDVLEQLRLLTNLETNQKKLLQIMLIGQPELRAKLSKPELRQLSQRIIARYHLGSLSKREVNEYLAHRLSIAGLNHNLFPPSTVNRIYHLSGGIPRLINVLCDRALLGTYTQNKHVVNSSTLSKAAQEVLGELNARSKVPSRKTVAWILSVLLLIVVGVVLAASYYNDEPQKKTVHENVEIAESDEREPFNLETLNWPADQPVESSREMAFQELFRLWGIPFTSQDGLSPCSQAKKHNLKCYENLGSMNTLRHISRPAIMKLYDSNENIYYAALTDIKENSARFVLGSEVREVSFESIEPFWLGEYTLLWRPPPGYRHALQPGTYDPVVLWLEKQLSIIKGGTTEPRGTNIYDSTIVTQVKKFQLSKGLIPEGVVGTQTLIHLNSAIDSEIPTLRDGNKGK